MSGLHEAARKNDVDWIKRLLDRPWWRKLFQNNNDLVAVDHQGKKPLHHAVGYQLQFAQFLRSKSPDVSMYTFENAASLLLKYGASANAKDFDGVTPLHIACCGVPMELVELLLEQGADVSNVSRWGRTPLHMSAGHGEARICDLLLRHRAEVDAVDKEGRTPLAAACCNDHMAAAETLLRGGANSASADVNGATPLHWAAVRGNVELVQLLLKAGAAVDVKDKDGQTPLRLAAAAQKVECADVLMTAGASPSAADANGTTPFMAAAAAGCVPIVQLLLTRVSPVLAGGLVSMESVNALHAAALHDRADVIAVLLDAGTITDGRDALGSSALHYAAKGRAHAALTTLLERGIQPDIGADDETTPLHAAATGADATSARLLLRYGADPNRSLRSSGLTPLHLAAKSNSVEFAQVLLDSGAAVDPRTADGWTPLHEAVTASEEMIDLLLSRGADVNARSVKGYSPLHRAAGKGLAAMVRFLLRHGADINAADFAGDTAWEFAVHAGAPDVREALTAHAKSNGKTPPRRSAIDQSFRRVEACARWGAEQFQSVLSDGSLTFSGGEGETMEDAVRVETADAHVAIEAEHWWLERKFGPQPGISTESEGSRSNDRWSIKLHSVREQDDRSFDEFRIESPDGSDRIVYFDITRWIARGASMVPWMLAHISARSRPKGKRN